MRRVLLGMIAVAALWACGGKTFGGPADGGGDDASSSGSGSGSSGGGSSGSGSSGSSTGSSTGSSSGSASSGGSTSGGSSCGGGCGSSGSSSGGEIPVNHRPDDSQCLQAAPPGDCNFSGSGSGGPPVECTTDSQCVDAGVNGRCVNFGGGPAGCFCTSDTCADDGACPTGQTCACHGSAYNEGRGNSCVPGNCRVDADCGPGGYCSPSSVTMGCGGIGGYYCHTPQDQCVNDGDCADAGSYDVCAYDTSLAHWRCTMQYLCGDPVQR